MRHTILLVALFILSTAAPAVAGAPASWAHVTVLYVDGARRDDVTLTWALDGFLLALTSADGTGTMLSPDRVRAVLDQGGRDLTDEVGQACPAEGISYRLLGEGKNVPFRFAVMVEAGAGLALSNANGDTPAAGVLLAGLRVGAGEHAHLRLGYRRQHVTETTTFLDREVAADVDELLVLAGLRLTHPRDTSNYAYLEAGVSLVHFSQRFGADGAVDPDADLSGTGITMQGGVVLPLSRHLGLDLGAGVAARPSLDADDDGMMLSFGVNTALAWRD